MIFVQKCTEKNLNKISLCTNTTQRHQYLNYIIYIDCIYLLFDVKRDKVGIHLDVI